MTESERNFLLKAISFDIGHAHSVKPEVLARAAPEAIELQFELVRKP